MADQCIEVLPAPPTIVERRAIDASAILGLVTAIHADVKAMDLKLTTHMAEETTDLALAITDLMSKAFPAGDPQGHRAHHEAVIKKAEESAQFWKTMRVELGKWGLLCFVGFMLIAGWKHFLEGPK